LAKHDRPINGHQIVPFETLPNGRLLTSWGELLPGIRLSYGYYCLFDRYFATELPEEDSPLWPIMKKWHLINFDEMCGHWVADISIWKPHSATEYVYAGGRGAHALMFEAFYGEIPAELIRVAPDPHGMDPLWGNAAEAAPTHKERGSPVDHRCMLKICLSPLHLGLKSTCANTAAARIAHERVGLQQMGQTELFDAYNHLR
jgi:hypothetical protein